MLIISKTYQVDRFWSYISVDRKSRINTNKYPKSINLIDFGVLSLLIDLEAYQVDRFWSYITVDKYPRYIKLIDFGVLSVLIDLEAYSC